jgi:peptidyl-prolyl cis-trans isomerase D
MLENIRESSQGMTAKIILGLVILTFALAGIGSYTNSVDMSVAEVNGEKISQDDFNKAYQAQRNRMQQQFGDMFERLAADETYMANFRNGVVDSLINERLIDQNTSNLAVRVSDERIKETIRTMPEFQIEGKFDNNRYLALINQAGFYQSSDFRDYLRSEMSRRQLTQSLVASEFALPYQSKMVASLQNQKRDINYATIDLEQFKSTAEVSEDEINSFYKENQARFMNQEMVKVDYIALNVDDIAKTVVVSDEEVKAYYQDNIQDFRKEEQRRISHILIEITEDETAAKTLAESLLVKVNAGEDFAELAKVHSSDTFSGENGGDLDWLERGSMDETFDESAFALATVGDVSEVVKTEFGYHLIKLTDLKAEETKPLVDVQDELKAKVSNENAQEQFFELQQEMARLSFEFPDSLDDAAEAVNVNVVTSDWLSRSANIAPFDNAKAIEAAFSDMILNEQLNSDVIEVNDNLAIVLRLNEHQTASVKALAEVSDSIKSSLIAQKAKAKAESTVTELLAELKAGTDITEKLTSFGSKFDSAADVARFGGDIDRAITEKAFTLPHPVDGVKSIDTADLANGNYALVELTAVKNSETAIDKNVENQQVNQLAQSAYASYVESLKVDAKISRTSLVSSVN